MVKRLDRISKSKWFNISHLFLKSSIVVGLEIGSKNKINMRLRLYSMKPEMLMYEDIIIGLNKYSHRSKIHFY